MLVFIEQSLLAGREEGREGRERPRARDRPSVGGWPLARAHGCTCGPARAAWWQQLDCGADGREGADCLL